MQEIWKDIYFKDKNVVYDYRGRYKISNLGRIKSFPRQGQSHIRYLKLINDTKNYLQVSLSKNNIHKWFKIHRLVAIMFIPNPENKTQVNHIDGNKQNNCVDNLEWCTNGENQIHAIRIGLKQLQIGSKNPKAKMIDQYDLNNNFIKTWGCMKDIYDELHIHRNYIRLCCIGKQKQTHGYIFKYHNK